MAAEMRRELGLTPASYLRLQKEAAEAARSHIDLEKLAAEGHRVLERREGRGD